jgi:hypothetical protein
MADAVVFCGYSKVRFSTKPAGAIIVANVLRSFGLGTVMIDHVFAFSPERIQSLIQKFVTPETRFVCLSTTLLGAPGDLTPVMSECDRLFRPIMDAIRAISRHCIFIVGGSKITRGEASSLPFDYQVHGQGETTLRAILLHELRGDPIHLSEGVTGRVSDKVYDFEGYSNDLSLVPAPEDCVSTNETLPIELGRGCVFKCGFCDYNLTGKAFGEYNKSPDTFRAILMQNYEQFGTRRYQFSDDTLNDSQEKIDRLCDVIASLPFKIEFGAYLRLEHFEKFQTSARDLLEAGLRGANFGVESLNKRAGATVGKGYGLRAVDTLHETRAVWRGRVAVHVNIIVGLPNDSYDDLEKQHAILLDHPGVDHVVYSALAIPRVGTSLFSQGAWQNHYTENEPSQYFRQQIQNNEKTRQFFGESVHWASRDMDLSEAIMISRRYSEDFFENRPYVVNNVSSFSVMSLLEFMTMEEMRTLRYKDLDSRLSRMAANKVNEYYQRLMGVEVLTGTQTQDITFMPRILPKREDQTFKSKITIPIRHELSPAHT